MNIVKHRKIYYWISAAITVASLACIMIWGLNFGIDFKGGSILEVSYNERPEMSVVQDVISDQDLGRQVFGRGGRQTGGAGATHLRSPCTAALSAAFERFRCATPAN